VPSGAELAPADLARATDSALVDLVSGGSVAAFTVLFDRTSCAVRAELAIEPPGAARIREIFASSYLEVWWLAGCRRSDEVDVTAWVTGIARRRIGEAGSGMLRRDGLFAPDGMRPSYAELEVAALLRRPVNLLLSA
jgi:hypothetical protein